MFFYKLPDTADMSLTRIIAVLKQELYITRKSLEIIVDSQAKGRYWRFCKALFFQPSHAVNALRLRGLMDLALVRLGAVILSILNESKEFARMG